MATDEDFQNALSAAASSQFNGTNFPSLPPEPFGPGAFGIPGVSGVPGSPGGPPRGRGFLAGLNDVLTKISQSQKQKNEEIAQQQKLLQLTDERKAQQQRIDLEHERLDQEAATRDLNLKAAAAVNQAHTQEMKMQATKIMSEIAARPTSETAALPGVTNLGGGPANSDTVDLNVPGLGVMHLPTDEKRNRDLTARVTAAQDPLEKNRLELQAARDRDAAAKLEESKKEDFNRLMAVGKQREDAELLRTKLHEQGENYRANLKTGPDPNFDPTPYTEGAANGTTAQEEISKLSVPQRKIVTDINTKAGVIPPTAKQKQFIGGLGGVVSTIQDIDEYLDLAKKGAVATLSPAGNTLRKNVNENIVQSMSALMSGASNRLSQQRIEAAKDAYSMSISPFQDNQMKRDKFVKTMNNVIDLELTGMSVAQKQHVKEVTGLDKFLNPQATPAAVDPHVKAYADTYFGGDIQKAQAAIDAQKGTK